MFRPSSRFVFFWTVLVLSRLAVAQDLVVEADELWTMAPGALEPIRNAVVVIRNGKIAAVGSASKVSIPEGVERLEAQVATPGWIDAHTVVGLSGIYNVPHDQDQLDRSAPIQPELRAVDAYNAQEALVAWIRKFGVTTIHTGHGPGALISGQTMIAKTWGRTVERDVLVPEAMVAATLGPEVSQNFDSPGTRAKGVALLRAEFIKAQEYVRKRSGPEKDRPARDLRLEVLGRVLSRELPLLVTAQRVPDIYAALRLQREFGFRLVLDGAAEIYQIVEDVKAAGVPVIIHPTMARLSGATRNASLETAALLADKGIPFAFQSGYESYVPKTRVVLFEAAVAAAHGLGRERALAALTREAAQLLGIDSRVGSLEVGKDGDLVLFDGDPFETTSHVCGVVLEGQLVERECH
jgi:imidazolonepropionase-like amidohydrolase